MTDVTIAREDPRQPDVLALIRALDDFHLGIYPAEANHFLDIETLVLPEVRFLVARRAGEALGCGALWVKAGEYGEVKRMFLKPEARGLGIGRQILARIVAEAHAESLPLVRLETGNVSDDALRLYRAAGFRERGPYGDYPDHPASVFMEMTLEGASREIG
jgi:putative acetyltransferase